jgi:Fe-S cluster assembly protein SufD
VSKPIQSDDSNKAHYQAQFANFDAERGGSWLAPIARDAFAQFETLGFPTRHLEEWRYTNVAPIARLAFTPASCAGDVELDALSFESFGGSRVVFVDGHYSAELSDIVDSAEIQFETLARVGETEAASANTAATIYGTLANSKDDGFAAFNTAFAQDGAVITFQRGDNAVTPVHLIFVSRGDTAPVASLPRVTIVAKAGSQGLVVQDHISLSDNTALTCAVSEIVTEADSSLDVVLVQRESDATYHIAKQCVRQHRNSRFGMHTVNLGGAILRNDLQIVLAEEHSECSLNGLYLATGGQIVDNHTLVDHAVPDCTSDEYYKGIMAERSRGVFRGRVLVRPDAQRTAATQQNRNLLLARTAEVDTKPQLEIYADDVKCNHGSSIGQLDADALFFLRARGLNTAAARVLLTMGFASQVTQSIANPDIRAWAAGLVTTQLEALFDAGGVS